MTEETNIQQKPSLFGMIFNPTEQFERMKERPLIWAAMALVTVGTVVGMWLMSTAIDISEIPEVEEIPGMEVFTQIGFALTGLFVPIISVLFSSFIHWIVIKIARSETTFAQLFSMNTYIMIITAVGLVLNGVLTILIGGDGETMFTSLASLIPAEGAILGLYQNLEVFGIWRMVLIAIGLHKVGNLSKGAAWGVSIAFFIILLLFGMISAGLNEALGSFGV